MTVETIKPDTRAKDLLIKKEATWLAQRASAALALETLLASIPKLTLEAIPSAVEALLEAADQYKASNFLVDREGRRIKPKISDARASINALQNLVSKALLMMSDLPFDTSRAIGRVSNAPYGKTLSMLKNISLTIDKAQAELAKSPDKEADTSRRVLAYQVALVFQNILKIKPSTASDKQLFISGKRGGAAYARVLRSTLKIAGVTDYDPNLLIKAGLGLLKANTT